MIFKVNVVYEGAELTVEGKYHLEIKKDMSEDISLEIYKIYDTYNRLYNIDLIDDEDFLYDLTAEVFKLIDITTTPKIDE